MSSFQIEFYKVVGQKLVESLICILNAVKQQRCAEGEQPCTAADRKFGQCSDIEKWACPPDPTVGRAKNAKYLAETHRCPPLHSGFHLPLRFWKPETAQINAHATMVQLLDGCGRKLV